MDEFDRRAFAHLFKAVITKCFGQPLSEPLSEPESRHLSNELEEHTGLVVGWKSIKNYAAFLLTSAPGKQENPSIATLDTLARYVLNAPVTSEAERKKTGEHFSYWFRYRDQVKLATNPAVVASPFKTHKSRLIWVVAGLVLLVTSLLVFLLPPALEHLQEDFHATDEVTLEQNGWFVQDKNVDFWNRRGQKPGYLTLFTLKGDNWPKTGETPRVQNLLLQKISNECFSTEVHFTDFVPNGNWQQAGLILLEDTLFRGKSIRLSLSYNNFFGGYVQPGEILIQGVASLGNQFANLEEFIHQPLFKLGNADNQRIATTNLKNVAFRVEKQGQKFRFLYSASPVDNFSFKELTTYSFGMTPKYIGLFALKGFVDTTTIKPVPIRFFRLDGQSCD